MLIRKKNDFDDIEENRGRKKLMKREWARS